MSDITPTPADNTAPATEPEVTPAPENQHPDGDPGIFAEILYGLTGDGPAKKDPEPEVKPDPEPEPAPEPKPEPAPKKKVTVTRKPEEPKPDVPSVEEIVRRTMEAQKKPAEPAPAAVPTPELDDLNEDEREELELAKFAEQKDPTKYAGLAAKLTDFYKKQSEFLAKAQQEDPDYDPASDPKFKKFLSQNEPKFSPSEKRRLWVQKETESAVTAAVSKVKQELGTELETTRAQLREIQEKPRLVEQVGKFKQQLFSGVEDEAFKAFVEKGEAAAEDFPIEAEVLAQTQQDTTLVVEEFLALRNRLKAFDAANPAHAKINGFIVSQGDAFEKLGGKHYIRDGKQFVHPAKWNPALAATHWTFSNEDVVAALRVEAQREAKKRIASEHARIEKVVQARAKKAAPAPVSAAPKVTPPQEEVSPRVAPAPRKEGGALMAQDPSVTILGIGT